MVTHARWMAVALVLSGAGCNLLWRYESGAGEKGLPRDGGSGEPGDRGGEHPAPACDPVQRPCHVEQLAIGYQHSCVVADGGNLWCWGDNHDGQLGLGDRIDRALPHKVALERVKLIGLGHTHTCATDMSGKTWCWGQNESRQLGPGSGAGGVPVPVDSGIVGPVDQLALGGHHSCARLGGTIRCWGSNVAKQLGVATSGTGPFEIAGLTGFSDLARGENHCCAVMAGRVLCWGQNKDGETGQTSTGSSNLPETVNGLSDVQRVGCGQEFSCALDGAAKVSCWGANYTGQLGDGTVGGMSITPRPAVAGASALAVGGLHACALVDSKVHCWGYGRYGQLGLGEEHLDSAWAPQPVQPLTSVMQIAAGHNHTCALGGPSGPLWCWGGNTQGQIGNGKLARRAAPKVILGFASKALVSGGNHSCALNEAGTVFCWGHNAYGQAGQKVPINQVTPIQVTTSLFTSLGAGGLHTCAIDMGGAIYGWGAAWAGQLGKSQSGHIRAPVPITGLSGAIEVAGGHDHTCARFGGGIVKCWGDNASGQLGDLDSLDGATMMPLAIGASRIAARGYTSCAVHFGSPSCWGRNSSGQLGIGNTSNRSTPTLVLMPPPVTAIAVGGRHACATTDVLGTKGQVYCWGENGSGQVGNNLSQDVLSPRPVNNLAGVVELSLGWMHSCARTANREVFCWGNNSTEQLGSVGPSRGAPQAVMFEGKPLQADALAAGWFHTCARRDTDVLCWGDSSFGQLGDGQSSGTTSPVQILP